MNNINANQSNFLRRKMLFWGGGAIVLICILLVVSAPFVQNRQNIKYLGQNGGTVAGLEKPSWMPEKTSQWLLEKKNYWFHHVTAVQFVWNLPYTTAPPRQRYMQLTRFPRLRHIKFSQFTLNEAELKHLDKLPKLTHLSFIGPTINDDDLKYLSKAKSLVHLKFDSTEISDVGLRKHLAHLTKLESISFSYSDITSKDIKKLKKALPKCDITNWTGEW